MNIKIDDPSSWKKLPADLQAVLSEVQRGNFHYPGREDAWNQALKYLQSGDFSLAAFRLKEIQTQQDNLRQGISTDLQQLQQAVQAGAVNYPGREDAWNQALKYLQSGDFSLAAFRLKEIQTQQDNLRNLQ